MIRLAYLPWCIEICHILGETTIVPTRDLELMWRANMTPVEAAAAILVAQVEEELNR